MLKTVTKVIDGEEFSLQVLGGMQCQRLFHKLVKAVGPALSKLAPAIAAGKGIAESDVGVVGEVVGLLAEKLSEDDYEALLNQLLYSLRRGKKDISPTTVAFETEFGGRPKLVLKLLWFGLEANFGDFFSGRSESDKPTAPAAS